MIRHLCGLVLQFFPFTIPRAPPTNTPTGDELELNRHVAIELKRPQKCLFETIIGRFCLILSYNLQREWRNYSQRSRELIIPFRIIFKCPNLHPRAPTVFVPGSCCVNNFFKNYSINLKKGNTQEFNSFHFLKNLQINLITMVKWWYINFRVFHSVTL